jgi:hypothetical protein
MNVAYKIIDENFTQTKKRHWNHSKEYIFPRIKSERHAKTGRQLEPITFIADTIGYTRYRHLPGNVGYRTRIVRFYNVASRVPQLKLRL